MEAVNMVTLVSNILKLRAKGLAYKEVDERLGLDNGTPFSAYRIMKTKAAKVIAASLELEDDEDEDEIDEDENENDDEVDENEVDENPIPELLRKPE